MSTSPAETERRASASVLCDILAQIAAVLAADPDYAAPGTQILTEDKGDIDTEIANTVGALGICSTVMFSGASGCNGPVPGPVFASASYLVEICELAVTNRSQGGRTCLETAELAARLLHQARLPCGRVLLVTAIDKYPAPPAPADNCCRVILTLSNVSLNRKAQTT